MTFAWLAFFDALIAVAMIAAGVIGAHFYLVAPFMGFQLFALGFLLSILGSLIGLLAIFLTRKPSARAGRNRALVGTAICLIIALPLLVLTFRGGKYPAINDITTDFDNPPEFAFAQKLQHEPNRDMKYDKSKYADRQRAGYGPIAPLKQPLDPSTAFARVTEVAKAQPTWTITHSDPATNTLEAVDASGLFHFEDDIVIQVRPGANGQSLIEMRSKSRDGIGDQGVNAKRIRGFFDQIARSDANAQQARP
jgi:uncharacterized protein (DUF1499 family)